MSSPGPTFASSSSSTSPRRIPKSNFTYKQLHQLKSYSVQTPLRVIAHVDLDAFYAQCETVRLGIDPAKPLAVQQWQGLIAINYPARAFGLSRHVTSAEALKQCPDIILQHVATWREGDDKWAYHENSFRDMATHKVSLDPYRMESRKILKCIRDALPEKEQRVEKAGIDEVFLDLSAQVHAELLQRYPELRGPAPYDDPTERLPKVSTTVLDWAADALVETGEEDGEHPDPDWDDVCMAIASEIVRRVRQRVKDTLGYTCSGGVARNKMLAKLGSAYKKPNQQTVIRNRAIGHFLSDMKFTKIRMLGGKLGDEVVALFGTDKVKDVVEQPLEQLKKKLGDDTGSWLYATMRGSDASEVNPRTQIKSMLSAKSFRPAITSFEQGVRWLRIFVADIFSRCVEEGVLENKRRPKTINLHHRQAGHTKSRQAPLPQGKPLSEPLLFDLAKNLLAHVVVDGRAWPCSHLSLSVGGFEDGIANNKGIGGFLVRGAEAKAMMSGSSSSIGSHGSGGGERAAKRRRTKGNIARFFGPRDDKKRDFDAARAVLMKGHGEFESVREEEEEEEEHGGENEDEDQDQDENDILDEQLHNDMERPPPPPPPPPPFTPPPPLHQQSSYPHNDSHTPPSAQPLTPWTHSHSHSHSSSSISKVQKSPREPSHTQEAPSTTATTTTTTATSTTATTARANSNSNSSSTLTFFCTSCNMHLPLVSRPEHTDYHFALTLSRELRHDRDHHRNMEVEGGKQVSKGSGKGRGTGTGTGTGTSNSTNTSSRRMPPKGQTQAKLSFGRPGS